ncbi:hypothetical protein CSQ96_25695 [Janthinobacterium sp. BJB412]|nr:hypothetical protein CSQ96_25695 [Janthinobacterium sp. BJB412]
MPIQFKRLRTASAAALLCAGALAASHAAAAPLFTVNPNSNGLSVAGQSFEADTMSGSSSARLVFTGGTNYSSVGYIQYSAFVNPNTGAVPTPISRIGFDYGLYATFSQTFTCSGLLSPGVTCAVTSIALDLWADAGNDNAYSNATLASAPTVTSNGVQVKLGSVSTVVQGQAGLDALGGAFQNVNTNFALTAAGALFFTSPTPFYSLAFSAFNNTTQGIACNTGPSCVGVTVVAINSESGNTDFNRAVPEPGPLALIGIGMIGLIVSRRAGKAKS